MRTIRSGVFETNSSSTHSLTIMTQEKYSKWTDDTYLYNDEIYTFEEAKDFLRADKYFMEGEEEVPTWTDADWLDAITDWGFERKEYFGGDCETFEEFFTTPSGDKMVAFGYYGYDG